MVSISFGIGFCFVRELRVDVFRVRVVVFRVWFFWIFGGVLAGLGGFYVLGGCSFSVFSFRAVLKFFVCVRVLGSCFLRFCRCLFFVCLVETAIRVSSRFLGLEFVNL